jgi:signal transduction histidine kinase
MTVYLFQLLVAALVLAFGFFIFLKNYQKKTNAIFLLFSLCLACWLFASFLSNVNSDNNAKVYWFKISYIGIIFISVTFFHFVSDLFKERFDPIILKTAYLLGLIFCFLLAQDNLIIGLYHYSWGYYPRVNPITHISFLAFFCSLFTLSLVRLLLTFLKQDLKSSFIQRARIKYLCVGGFIGTIGAIDFFPNYGFSIYPIGFIFILIFFSILGYAVYKFNLLDIRIAFTRIGIFFLVYALVLGIPIWVGLKLLGAGLWLAPMILMGFFSTGGPFIYLYIQKKAEDRLLQEQHRYQATLRQASAGMGRVKDLKKLINLIVYIVTRAVRLEHTYVYINDEQKNQLIVGAYKVRANAPVIEKVLPSTSPLIPYLIQSSAPIIYEEIKQKAIDYHDSKLSEIEKIIAELGAALVVPVLIEKKLLAIVVLGKKESGKSYTEDDLSVFAILANQAALAIENAQFYEDMKKTQEQLFQAEKMATIGTMADGLSHQINNRFHALGFIAGDALDTIKMNKDKEMAPEIREIINDLERSFTRVQENVTQGGEVVQGLLRYTRKGDAGFTAVDFDQAYKSAYEMAQFKIKTQDLKVVKSFDPATIPKIKGNFTQLQEVFFNLTDNAYDAMMQRKTEKKEPGFQPTLTLTVERLNDGHMEIIFADNGIGVKEDDSHKLFTPFFTTKLSSKKGTGLGLYVIKKIIEENHKGKVEMVSKYMVGTQMKLRLPIAE